jgi:hypothetical protein
MFVGLVAAKENSKRFKNKNIHPVNGYPMFWHSVKPLIESKLVEEVYVLTDSDFIKQYCHEKGVKIIHRPYNASRSEDKLISVLRYGYYNLDQEYEVGLNEVRSFNKSGEESGLIVFSKHIMESNQDVSYYIGGVTDEVTEIHYQSDLENL